LRHQRLLTLPASSRRRIEDFFNGTPLDETEPNSNALSPELQQFKAWHEEKFEARGLEAYRTEPLLFSEPASGVRIAGAVDLLAREKEGDFWIFDWKRSKEIKKHGYRKVKVGIELSHCGCPSVRSFTPSCSSVLAPLSGIRPVQLCEIQRAAARVPVAARAVLRYWWVAKRPIPESRGVFPVYTHALPLSAVPAQNLVIVSFHPDQDTYKEYPAEDLSAEVADMFAHFEEWLEKK
jgi:hypothetical protein